MKISWILVFPLALGFEDLSLIGTPRSFLKEKCAAFPQQSVFIREKCFIAANEECNHLRGFGGHLSQLDNETANIFESQKTSPTKICEYSDEYSCGKKDWSLFGNHCFRVFGEMVTHKEASRRCGSLNGSLAVPHNDEDIQFISKLVFDSSISHKNKNSFFWIGLWVENHLNLKTSDGTSADHFRWVPLGHKRSLSDAFKTPNTAGALAASPANSGQIGVFGYNQIINGNYHKLPFVCQQKALIFGRSVYIPNSILK